MNRGLQLVRLVPVVGALFDRDVDLEAEPLEKYGIPVQECVEVDRDNVTGSG